MFVGNLSYNTDENALRDYFKQIGKINDVRLALTHAGKSKGFAHIDFKYREDVNKAIKKLNKMDFEGRDLKLDSAPGFDEDAYDSSQRYDRGDRNERGYRGDRGYERSGDFRESRREMKHHRDD